MSPNLLRLPLHLSCISATLFSLLTTIYNDPCNFKMWFCTSCQGFGDIHCLGLHSITSEGYYSHKLFLLNWLSRHFENPAPSVDTHADFFSLDSLTYYTCSFDDVLSQYSKCNQKLFQMTPYVLFLSWNVLQLIFRIFRLRNNLVHIDLLAVRKGLLQVGLIKLDFL